jgi:tetratricopeptide (TPR) repeat protein
MEQALYYFRFGDALRRLERQDDAVQRYEQALDLNASHLPTLEAVGPLYVERSDWDSASRVFRQILQLTGGQGDPERLARVYSCLGTVEHAQGNTDKAVLRYKRALELQPNDIAALRGYSCVLYAKKDWNNLLNSYNNIIYHAKEKVAFIDAYLMKGFVLDVHMSLADKAAQHYEKSLSFDPSHPVALLRLSELALRKDDWDRALSYASRALSVGGAVSDTVRAQLMVVQAIGYTQSGRPEEGQAALESAQTVSHDVGNSSQTGIGDPSGLHEALRRGLQEAL